MPEPRHHHIGGFTLIEILVSIALFAIMASVGVTIFAVINTSSAKAKATSEIQSQTAAILEQLERSIRSADSATNTPSFGCSANQCLALEVPAASLDYQANGSCPLILYRWYSPSSNTNGRLTRAWVQTNGSACNGGEIDLFNTDNKSGVSIESTGGAPIFPVNTYAAGPVGVTITFSAAQGVTIPAARRVSVQFASQTTLRKY